MAHDMMLQVCNAWALMVAAGPASMHVDACKRDMTWLVCDFPLPFSAGR